jgi:hypothetical protein
MVRWPVALPVAGVVALGSQPARAGDPASLEWSAPLSCPAREAILERFQQGNEPSGAIGSIDARINIEEAAEDRYRARVELVVGHQWSFRSLEASTCEAIAEAVVVIVRVAAAAEPGGATSSSPRRPDRAASRAPRPRGRGRRRNLGAWILGSRGLDETLTVIRLNLPSALRRTFATTNPIENMNGSLRRIARNVKRCKDEAMIRRWVALGIAEAQKGFRRVKGYVHMPSLVAVLRPDAATMAAEEEVA